MRNNRNNRTTAPDSAPEDSPDSAPDSAPDSKTLEDMLNASGEVFELASGKVTRKTVSAAETVADRATLYAAKLVLASQATTTANIAAASGNRTRSVIATCRGLCGLIMIKAETPQAAALRMLFGNGRTHFSSFLKLPKLQIKQLPRVYATSNCVNADGAIESHGTTEVIPVLFATR